VEQYLGIFPAADVWIILLSPELTVIASIMVAIFHFCMIAHGSASACLSNRRRHQHVVVQIGYNPRCSGDHDEHDEQAEGKCQYVVGAVRPAGHVQEKHQVNAHLGNREDREAQAHAARPKQ
jgi:hypothetical protein